MRSRRDVLLFTALALATSCLLLARPAEAVEDGLFGVRIGASYRELTEKFGTPHGILFPSGSGLIFQTPVALASGQAVLPNFGQQAQTVEIPVWVLPIRAASLLPNQTQWVYDFREKYGFAIGIVLNGEGADAIVTDVIAAGFPKYLNGRTPIKTAKGVMFESTFEDVLKRYGYPPLIEIFAPSGGGPTRQAAGGAMRAGVGARGGGMRAGGGQRGGGGRAAGRGERGGGRGARGEMRGGRGRRAEAPGLGSGLLAQFQLELTAAPGGRGGRGGSRGEMMGGGGRRGGGGRGGGAGASFRGGAMRGGGRAGGAAARTLPPLGTAGPGGPPVTASAVVDHQAVSFSRECTLVYEGIAFTLHDMHVYRIHVSE